MALPGPFAASLAADMIIRALDIIFSALGLLILLPFLFVIFLIGLADTGSPLFRQERVGQFKTAFVLVKFRTMKTTTPSVASHLVQTDALTRWGQFLRKSKIDELPQLWNVFCGDMSLVGPRPNLFNQHELTKERDRYNVYRARPGMTGLSQLKGIDMSTPAQLARSDSEMLSSLSSRTYFLWIFRTLLGGGSGDAAIRNSKSE